MVSRMSTAGRESDSLAGAGLSPTAGQPVPDRLAAPPALVADSERRPATDAERRALASVVRLRILRLCLYEELTNRQLAERLRMNPATTLHHVRTLAELGFLLAGEVQRGRRGAREIPYRATGKSWTLDMGHPIAAAGGRSTLLNTFLAEVAEVPESDVSASRLGLQLSAEHEEEFRGRLAELLNEFALRPHDPDGRRWSVFLAIHPEP